MPRFVCQPLLLAALLISTGPSTTHAQTTGRALAVEDYYRARSIGNARISPDGEWVLHTVSMRVEENNGTSTETWLVAADGNAAPRRIMHDGREVTGAEWRDDSRVRYTALQESWAIDPRRADARPERDTSARQDGITSPDGMWRATTRRAAPDRRPVTYASDFERRHEERFRGAQFAWLSYKRDGARAPVPDTRDPLLNPPAEIAIVPTQGGEVRQLTRLALQPSNLRWNRASDAIVFTADPDYRDELTYGGGKLWLATIDGTVRRLTEDNDYVYSGPEFSPDGRWLAYTRTFSTDKVIRERLDHGGSRDLFIMPANGRGTPRNLTAEWDLEPGAPLWHPDSRSIYFMASIGGESHLFRVPVDGGAVEQITRGPRRITSFTVDRAFRRIAYLSATYERLPEVYVANIDGTGERRVTNVHADFFAEVQPGRAQRVNFRSKDGTPIEGWLIFPYGYRADAGTYPLIVNNHGGPHSAVGYGWEFKEQLFAARGYFVLEINFRSSTGYGDAFKWGTWGAWGTRDGEDVMAGVDYVLASYPIDRARVGTTGHSYGGFMTNWLITQYPDRFAAAVSGAGISNWISDYGLADIARTKETEFFGKPWQPQAREIMLRQSPLMYADRVRTPTLFVHGEIDYRVPFAEAEQFYFALKKNGVPTKIIMYEGQSHGISGHWNNVHRMLNELKWWDTYLKARPAS